MYRIDGKRVSRSTYALMMRARIAGVLFILNSGRRTMAEQRVLFHENMMWNGVKWVPKPGKPVTAWPSPTAPHIRVGRQDHADDIHDENGWATGGGAERFMAYAWRHGVPFRRPVSSEPWHCEAVSEAQLIGYARRNPPLRILRKGVRPGEDVRHLQVLLRMADLLPGDWETHTKYGRAVRRAVKRLQRKHGLTANAVVDPRTWAVAIRAAHKTK